MADKTATFGIRVQADSNATEAARSVEDLKNALLQSQDAVKSFGNAQRALRGTSDEVKEAKSQLKGAINAERDAISRATLELGKHGLTLTELQRRSRAMGGSAKEAQNAVSQAGGAAGGASAEFAKFGASLGIGDIALGNIASTIVTKVVGAFVALTTAIFHAGESLVGFILESANLLRAQGLQREAAAGSAENAKNWGEQIEEAAKHIPKTRAELNELSVSISKTFLMTRISGQGMVDAFNAVGQESAAMGDKAGAAIEDVLSRGRMMGRFGLGFRELLNAGTGIQFADVAKQLSKNLGISLQEAQNQLVMYRVKLDDGAKAVRQVVEKQFGGINARKLIDLDFMAKRFRDTLQSLTKAVNLERILTGLDTLLHYFDEGEVAGDALRAIFKDIGDTIGSVFDAENSPLKGWVDFFVLTSQRLYIELLKLEIQLIKTFGKGVFDDIPTAAIQALADTILFTAKAFGYAWGAMRDFYYTAREVNTFMKENGTWSTIGKAIIFGIVEGLKGGVGLLWDAIKDLGKGIKDAFAKALGIHSPSTVFAALAENIPAGIAVGVEAGAPRAEEAVQNIITPKSIGAAVTGGASVGNGDSGGHTFNVTVQVDASGGKNGEEMQASLTGPSFRAQFTKMLEECLTGAGVPTQVAP